VLNGKVVIVTCAARGIGQEYCVRFASMGATVVATATIDSIKQAGGREAGRRMNVTEMASVAAIAEQTFADFARIDGLVNNAALYGALRGGRFEAISGSD
jgi:NAD(P)-dependent dehydrogenase (short-subunit alcohol dehydrogenase family)